MIRFVFRFVGFLVLAAAFAALLYDGTKTIAGSDIHVTSLQTTWANFHPASLQWLQPAIERNLPAWFWDTLMVTVLTAPTWAVLGVLGALLILAGRKRQPLIGYSR
jgi:hypothetical protein